MHPHPWLEVVPLRKPGDSSLMHLDAGERDAIALAAELQASLLLMDERDGADVARARDMKVIGTLGVLDVASAHGWVDLPAMFDRFLWIPRGRVLGALPCPKLSISAKRGVPQPPVLRLRVLTSPPLCCRVPHPCFVRVGVSTLPLLDAATFGLNAACFDFLLAAPSLHP
jgi:hypothetical protein